MTDKEARRVISALNMTEQEMKNDPRYWELAQRDAEKMFWIVPPTIIISLAYMVYQIITLW
jgi:hypothetical protein